MPLSGNATAMENIRASYLSNLDELFVHAARGV